MKFKSSEMAKIASKTVNSNVNLLIIIATLNNELQIRGDSHLKETRMLVENFKFNL